MRSPYQVPLWKTAPLFRLLLPMIAGILLQWYLHFALSFILLSLSAFLIAFFLMFFLKGSAAFYLRHFRGLILHFVIAALALLLTWHEEVRHDSRWYGFLLPQAGHLVVRIDEPLLEKDRTYKAEATVTHVIRGSRKTGTLGKILLYFAKDSLPPVVNYGDVIITDQTPQTIRNTGNPAAFNYKRYAAFQGIHHQVFLQTRDWQLSGHSAPQPFRRWLYKSRAWVLAILEQFIGDENHELGIAEALLIGYKEDLDKTLVKAYTNTGVVHIIAISGLHLGLIFCVLTWIFNRTPGLKRSRHIKVALLLSCLWLFALLTGGSASVLRSAVMFTVIVIGKYYFRQATIYSSLSASAFLLLCYNPYYLWDVGFQLSYLAIIGIVALQQPMYKAWYIKNYLLRNAWNMTTITVAAQVTTFPVCLYYFHQFPNFFLVTNLLTVPFSTVILFTEIGLVMLSPISTLASAVGWLATKMITGMNDVILFFDGLPHGIIDGIYADVYTTWLLYALIFFLCAWLLVRKAIFLKTALVFLCGFVGLHALGAMTALRQQKLIIYNISKYRAVDFITGKTHAFAGDSALQNDERLINFHLRPSRIASRATKAVHALRGLENKGFYWQFHGKKLLVMDSTARLRKEGSPIPIDVLLLSHNAKMRIADLVEAVKPAIIVFDASNTKWQIEKWKKDCEALNLRFHSVSEQGAFILEAGESSGYRP